MGNGGAAQTTVVDSGGSPILATARYVEFVETSGGSDVYRELDVNIATPEPATLGLLAVATIPMLSRRRPLSRR